MLARRAHGVLRGGCAAIMRNGHADAEQCKDSMRMTRHALGFRDALEVDGEVQASAAIELADELALQFLPRRLAGRVVGLPFRLAFGQLGSADLFDALLIEVPIREL